MLDTPTTTDVADVADENTQPAPAITMGKAIGLYGALLAGLIVLLMLANSVSWFPGVLVFAAYMVFGFILNRVVLRGLVEWHPVYNTVENVYSGKLGMFLLWPLRYPVLFFQLMVVKHL